MTGPQLTAFPPVVGCYVDGVRGIYAVDGIIALAEAHGFKAKGCEESIADFCPRCTGGQHQAGDGSYTEWAHCQHNSEIEDEATAYMNEHHATEEAE